MTQPVELKKNEPLKWSPGTGVEVWDLFCAAITGDLKIERQGPGCRRPSVSGVATDIRR